MGKVNNALRMLAILRSRKKVTRRELAEELEVDIRQITRYKEDLEYAGVTITESRGKYGGYILENKDYLLNVLLDKNPFEESKEFQWGDLHKDGGKIFIIQLTGYTKDVQRIITEMILWDLWNYKTQHGNKNKPFAVILDEAQNLNFGDN